MKLTGLETFVVGNPVRDLGGRYWIFLKLTTADGVTGIGEVYAASFAPERITDLAVDVFERHFLDADPFRIEALWRNVYGSGYALRPDPTLLGILSGLEMACWDIVGKALDQPVHALLGGRVHEKLRAYTYLYPQEGDKTDVYLDAELAATRASEYAGLGFTAVKLDPAGPYSAFDPRQPGLEALERCETFVAAIREAVGNRCDILFGTHGQFTPAGAIRLARRLEPYDPLWFEEPTPPENPGAMAQVAAATSIPVASGERLTSKYEFARLLEAGAATILQPNLGRVGGLLEAKKIAGLAEAHYAQIAPHLYCGPVVGAANIQLATCSPNFLILEGILTWQGFTAEILKTPITWQEGFVIPPTAPGLGVELDEEVARAHPWQGDGLHLEMAGEPL
ncbi:MAG: mandelate racemase/muconate lactonizing enzyme family protein [Alphaproteobacteria bacterium]|jgi:2-dehydro-3-deoxyphosphogalactonate aldolase|nr:isomerase [Rhodospirillaceae bacterium]MDP6403971.1 mandelate racemase/muconate lactonizing enzyme family protein [Alphaproteobacteria bacterium]MDP6620798.1 mandelate racemase/muconate lactonizing enzyme family protein [Alphaproteobacteria bacterium]|tara:strand:- start:2160 stop:3344 length:1185 start_codon:yes stop_codon:yes gene_type:complete